MTVTCSWCVTLALVTAAVTLEVAGEVAGELVTPGTLLHHLTHGDTGSAANRSIGSTTGCTITEKAPTRAFS